MRTRFCVPWCVPVRFEQFHHVFDSGPPASRAPHGTYGFILAGGLIPDGSQNLIHQARLDARKKHHYVEIVGEKAFGEGNIGTKTAPHAHKSTFQSAARRRPSQTYAMRRRASYWGIGLENCGSVEPR